AMVDTLLPDEVVALVRRQDLADPIGPLRYGHAQRLFRHALAPPAGDIGPQRVRWIEVHVDLGREPPPAGPAAARPAIEGIEAGGELALHGPVPTRRGPLLDDRTLEQLVAALFLRDREEILERGGVDGLPGRTHETRVANPSFDAPSGVLV